MALKGKTRREIDDTHYENGIAAIKAMPKSMSKDGRLITCKYGHKAKRGRLFAKGAGCIQKMHRVLRHALCHGVCRDWDLVNSCIFQHL